MCIIVAKRRDVNYPSKNTLKQCFESNDDGAGFMYCVNGEVVIQKGYMSFQKFWKGLNRMRKKYGDNIPCIMHFRITTQGGVQKELTHPFPFSDNMDDLRLLYTKTNLGIAHNGIISLTSSYTKTSHSDTMEFITDYLSLIIKDNKFYEDSNIVKLINKLSGSKLAFLDNLGTINLLGSGWIEKDGIHYSNNSYEKSRYTYSTSINYAYDVYYTGDLVKSKKGNKKGEVFSTQGLSYEILWEDGSRTYELAENIELIDIEYYENFYNNYTGLYDFVDTYCPYTQERSKMLCDFCSSRSKCRHTK